MKYISFCLYFLLFFAIACTQTPLQNFPEYSFGVLETSSSIFTQTRVRLYNEKGDSIHTTMVPMGGIAEGFRAPSIGFNRFLYSSVEGTYTKGERALFCFDLLTGEFKIHEYDDGVRTILADDVNPDIVFFVDYDWNLIKWDNKKNKEMVRKSLSKYLLEHLKIYKKNIYFFAIFDEHTGSSKEFYHLVVLDKNTLEIEKKIDITVHGGGHISSIIYNNTLFFTNNWQFNKNDRLIPNNILSALDLNTYEITDYILPEENPYHIVRYKDQLIINHSFPQAPRMKKISTFDLNTHETKLYKLAEDSDYGFFQLAVQGDFLYAMDSFDLTKYDIANEFQKIAIYHTKTPLGDRRRRTFANSSHVSAFFLNPKND